MQCNTKKIRIKNFFNVQQNSFESHIVVHVIRKITWAKKLYICISVKCPGHIFQSIFALVKINPYKQSSTVIVSYNFVFNSYNIIMI